MQAPAKPRKPASNGYTKVFDCRKRRVRGRWRCHGRFFANLTVADDLGKKTSRWVPLNSGTLTKAIEDYRRLLVERDDDRLRPLGLTPTLADYIDLAALDAHVTQQRLARHATADDSSAQSELTEPTDAKRRHSYANQLTSSDKRQTSIEKERA